MDSALSLLHSVWLLLVLHADWIVGFGMPVLIQALTSDKGMSDDAKVWFSVVSCYLAAILFQWDHIKYGSLTEVIQSFGVIFAESHLMFITFFRTSKWRAKMMIILGVTKEEVETPNAKAVLAQETLGQG